jgi:pimeloyl-ACP methyl ester carboxylesterase
MQSQSQSHSHAPAQTPAVSSVQRHVVRRDSAQGEVSIDVRVDVRVDVRANSARHAPQLVLLPSLGRDSDDFDVIASALADGGYRVLRPAPRGMAGSRGPLQDITLWDLADDVAAVIEADRGLCASEASAIPAVVAGHAYGNWVARCLAVRHPALLRGVALLAAGHRGATPPAIREAISHSFDTSLPQAQRLQALQFAFFAPGHDASVWLEGWYPALALVQRAAAAAVPQEAFWHAGTLPVLDVQALQDVLAPGGEHIGKTTIHPLQDCMQGRLTHVLIDQAGHALIPEQPQAVVQALLRWMADLPTQAVAR